ncbi:MAG: hypothetical protein P4M08_10055 [Oligoflexia bacterium]|nr:hypothetical protein [Oligoflexia bacterium]
MKTKKILTNALTLIALASIVPTLSACTDVQIAEAVGAGAIIAGAVAIGATTHCVPGYDQVCHTFPDYYGNPVTECADQYDSCATLAPNTMASISARGQLPGANISAQAVPPTNVVNNINWGKTFGIGYDASAQLISASKTARDKQDPSALYALGLSEDDLKNLAQYQLPSAAGIDAMARKLDQKPSSIKSMLQTLISESKKAPLS